MVAKAPRLWQTSFNLYQWLMIVVHGYRATAVVLSLLLNIVVQTDYPAAVTAEMVRANVNSVDQSSKPLDVDLPPTLPMTFGTENSTLVSAQSGSTALLPCVVHNIGDGTCNPLRDYDVEVERTRTGNVLASPLHSFSVDATEKLCIYGCTAQFLRGCHGETPSNTVSWIKRKGVQQILTVGLTTYASDERFQAIHFHHSEDWSLQIKYVQRRDAGMYECQVSTHPPASIFLFLEVVEARAEIAGPHEKFVRPGSTLQLHCLVKKSTEMPSYLFWYHNFRMINYDVDQGVNVSTDLMGRESWLEVPRASVRHSGNYTCKASNAQPARAYVHIFDGENPAAMQHSRATSIIYYETRTNILGAILIALSGMIMSTIMSTMMSRTPTTRTRKRKMKLKLILDEDVDEISYLAPGTSSSSPH